MRCPACGARNTEDAAWCTQCFVAIPQVAHGDAAPGTEAPQGGVAAPDGQEAGPPEPAREQGRAVRVEGDLVEWRCAVCAGWNLLAASSCGSCGSPRVGFGPAAGGEDRSRPELPLPTALAASALLPGLGHLLRGATGSGAGRLLLWLLWGGGGVALLLTAGAGLAAAVLLAAAAALWAVSLLDLHRAAAGAAPIATGRVLAWAVVGVTLLLVVAMVAASWRGGAS